MAGAARVQSGRPATTIKSCDPSEARIFTQPAPELLDPLAETGPYRCTEAAAMRRPSMDCAMVTPAAVADVTDLLKRRSWRSPATLHGVVFEILAGSRVTPPGSGTPSLRAQGRPDPCFRIRY